MIYPNGAEVRVGDEVSFERGKASGTIVNVIETDFADWSVDEPGVMIKSAPFGLVFIPKSLFVSSELLPGHAPSVPS